MRMFAVLERATRSPLNEFLLLKYSQHLITPIAKSLPFKKASPVLGNKLRYKGQPRQSTRGGKTASVSFYDCLKTMPNNTQTAKHYRLQSPP